MIEGTNFFNGNDPRELVREYGSPLYVYNENILRERCRELTNLVKYPNFRVNYSAKANSNLHLLKVVLQEGLDVDAMSPGEMCIEELAGFPPDRILFISNNVSSDEMKYAIDRNILISVDSLSQLEMLGRMNEGGRAVIRFNPGIGAGHHEKVITGGRKTKFGINSEQIPMVKEVLKKYNMKLVGVNQHIGSLFMEDTPYLEAFRAMKAICMQFENLEFIDIGGGFGIPYRKRDGEQRLDMRLLGERLDEQMHGFAEEYGKTVCFRIEPGRYVSAECCVLLGSVHAVKYNGNDKYVGTDLGFNVLARPMMYDAYHHVLVYGKEASADKKEIVTVVGNICETGDIIAKERLLPEIFEGDTIGVCDAGAYGYAMSSNYNNRLRPAEVFIRPDGSVVLTRRRDTLESIAANFQGLQ